MCWSWTKRLLKWMMGTWSSPARESEVLLFSSATVQAECDWSTALCVVTSGCPSKRGRHGGGGQLLQRQHYGLVKMSDMHETQTKDHISMVNAQASVQFAMLESHIKQVHWSCASISAVKLSVSLNSYIFICNICYIHTDIGCFYQVDLSIFCCTLFCTLLIHFRYNFTLFLITN